MKKTDQKCETPISSLIDIVFLLIMFFVATANFDSEGFDNNVELAKAKNLQKMTTKPINQIPISVDYNNLTKGYDIKVGGINATGKQVETLLRECVKRMGSSTEAFIRVDKRCKLGALEEVTTACGAAGVATLKISAEAEGGK
ncbi:MAG: Biopolymer transport protein ExbD/TolR [Verrucomicrobiota bacterium]|jgi:biopolymer transport protein ExbD